MRGPNVDPKELITRLQLQVHPQEGAPMYGNSHILVPRYGGCSSHHQGGAQPCRARESARHCQSFAGAASSSRKPGPQKADENRSEKKSFFVSDAHLAQTSISTDCGRLKRGALDKELL